MGQAKAADPLTRARQAYNASQFDAAIAAAGEALQNPALANAAAVVLGHAHLERFRRSSQPAELEQARAAFKRVEPDRLAPRDNLEFLIGQGLALFFDGCNSGCYTASAEMLWLALSKADELADRERIFEWWAGALDRHAQFGPEADRAPAYRRILEGADAELAKHDRSASASYWIVAAARGAGDLERAWAAAIAGWARSRGWGKPGEILRADLDRFVVTVLLPERARQLVPDADARPMLGTLVLQWEELKKKYG